MRMFLVSMCVRKRSANAGALWSRRTISETDVRFHRDGMGYSVHVLNGTARRARAAQTEVVSNERKPQSLSDVQPGDVLVSHPTAVREHEISVIPDAPHAMSPTHDAAVSEGRSEADTMGVDAWLTEDQTHVVKIASNRAADK